ncbi:nitrate reductase molybdenum cofactor assembly chaperone [Virgibacillus xinjiangensis]|uniref:Nitrate reductase molybdenum cofactor assembly chaperone n=1 Tax=Virgibacillus xinjiangensis TaxID=393090 RepID=A0ABV7CWB8_9BACI
MNRTQTTEIYQILSFLLHYPSQQMKDTLPVLRTEIESIEDQQIKEDLQKFMEIAWNTPLGEWIDYYVEHFDFGRITNLYVTYLKLGEQRERGLELLKLKKFYESAGFDVSDHELPDYLPLMLEFCAQVPVKKSNELLDMHAAAIKQIHGVLEESENYYVLLFHALLIHMENNGVQIPAEEEMKAATK